MDKTRKKKNLFTFLIQPQLANSYFESQPKARLEVYNYKITFTKWIKLEKKKNL